MLVFDDTIFLGSIHTNPLVENPMLGKKGLKGSIGELSAIV